jgi:hypothetical protein
VGLFFVLWGLPWRTIILTFTEQYTMAQEITGDYSASRLLIFKRDINEGGAMFLNKLGRKFNREFKTTDIEEDKQYYQLSSDVLRITYARVLFGTNWYTPNLITNEDEWNDLNTHTVTGSYATHFFIRGFNEVGLYPVPSSNVTDGLSISFEPQHVLLTQADFTADTITVSNGSINVTHSGTGFTPQMVGRWVQVTDGTDGRWYRIAAYVSTSVLQLENYYEGISGSAKPFKIGEVMKIPQAYQDAPVYYALQRYYLTQADKSSAREYAVMFDEKVKSAKKAYGRSTSQMGVPRNRETRRPSWIDLTPTVTEY